MTDREEEIRNYAHALQNSPSNQAMWTEDYRKDVNELLGIIDKLREELEDLETK
jgi:hypothetical protein